MKRSLLFISNERGLILPLTLLITALLFLFLSTNVAIYHNELTITRNELSQLKIDTLFQMGRSKLTKELSMQQQDSGTVQYTFPDGIVEISYFRKSEIYQLAFSISTPDNKIYTVANQITLKKEMNNVGNLRSN
ncbi:hypothetical protein CFK37_14120 [Virgibacillus phasianinus]|uniref:Competence protein ComG n=1 Tax=Virgibacillus phasianinus TaxID=2017483 RepID=A0A220U5F7_9BACI|nr:hypothetical protein [Virgibacillus phasianinus]ASK63202.1 hypothetical protein CFK37_14120 [Virgibacillus phasianinus]